MRSSSALPLGSVLFAPHRGEYAFISPTINELGFEIRFLYSSAINSELGGTYMFTIVKCLPFKRTWAVRTSILELKSLMEYDNPLLIIIATSPILLSNLSLLFTLYLGK